MPSPGNPQALNRYAYVENSPLSSPDSTGHCQDYDSDCLALLAKTRQGYGVGIDDEDKLWSTAGLQALADGMDILRTSIGDKAFASLFHDLTFDVATSFPQNLANRMWYQPGQSRVMIDPRVLGLHDYVQQNSVHEMGHHWDWKCGQCMSSELMTASGSNYKTNGIGDAITKAWRSLIGDQTPVGEWRPGGKPPTEYAAKNNAAEDWAESLTVTLFPMHGIDPGYVRPWVDPRGRPAIVQQTLQRKFALGREGIQP